MKKSKRGWCEVSEIDDWGYIKTRVAGQDFAIPKSGKILLRFPDGHVDDLPVKLVNHMQIVNDMGHSYEVNSTVPQICLDYHGVKLTQRLGEMGVCIKI